MVDREAAKSYKDWKNDLHDHFKVVGGAANQKATRLNPPPRTARIKIFGVLIATGSCLTSFR